MAKVIKSKAEFSPLQPIRNNLISEEGLKVIAFYLRAGQKISLHTSTNRVCIFVFEGEGEFFIGSEEKTERLEAGDAIFYDRKEPHGFIALRDMIAFAFIVA